MMVFFVLVLEIPSWSTYRVEGSNLPRHPPRNVNQQSSKTSPLGPRGIKRNLKESLESDTGAEEDCDPVVHPATKRARSSWWSGSWARAAASPTALIATAGRMANAVATAVRRLRLPSWLVAAKKASNAAAETGGGKGGRAERKRWVVVRFKGDEDKPTAVRRQIDFYFSDSNLPTGRTFVGCDGRRCRARDGREANGEERERGRTRRRAIS
jgi:hypothetical protein